MLALTACTRRLTHLILLVVTTLAIGTVFSSRPAIAGTPGIMVPDRSIAQVEADLAAGRTTSVALVQAALARIAAVDKAGPHLNAIIAVNAHALADARRLDAERKAGHIEGPLHGIPLVVKDNIETADPMPTTAGSLALAANITHRDAPLVARLRAAGAIILAKTNLSEWANMRSPHSSSGWSGVGGLTRNPYLLSRSACGSSSGTGAAVAAGLVVAGIGTETDGSITCPSAANGLVGLKPTVGLVSRTHVVPISHSQDTAGPMATSVADAAALLTVLAGSDPADVATAEADAHRQDYTRALDPTALKGARIGVLRFAEGDDPGTRARFEAALAALRTQGAVLVDIKSGPDEEKLGSDELNLLLIEFKQDANAYLASAAPAVTTRTMAEVIAFDTAHADRELTWFGQQFLEKAQATRGYDADYHRQADEARRLAGPEGIDRMLADNKLVALVAPTGGPAWTTDLIAGDHDGNGGGAGNLAAIAGYPHLTVPMGQVHGLPVGLSFMGAKWSEAQLLALGYAYEQATHLRQPPTFARGPEDASAGER